MNKIFRRIVVVCVLIILSYFPVRYSISGGYYSMHDDTQIARVVSMGRAIRNGQFPVRWVADLGYGFGYPIYNFYGPLPYYTGGLLYSLGVDPIMSTKLMFFIGIVGSGIMMFMLVREVWGYAAGIASAALYLYAPYHAVQIYVRGAVGEYFVLVFLPILVLGIWRGFTGRLKQAFLAGSFGLAGIILSHTILGFITVLGLGCYIVIHVLLSKFFNLNRSTLYSIILILFGGLMMSAFFWLPAISEMKFTDVSGQISSSAFYGDHFVCLKQLWNSAWGFAGSAPGCIDDGMSFRIGKPSIILAFLSLVAWVTSRKKQKHDSLFRLGFVIVVVSLFLMTAISAVVWQYIPYMAYVQYPWRFLTFVNFGLAIIGASLIRQLRSGVLRMTVTGAIVLVCLLVYAKLFTPLYRYDIDSAFVESPQYLRWHSSRISDEYLPKNFVKPTTIEGIALSTIPSGDTYSSKTEYDIDIYSRYAIVNNADTDIILNRAYFPGWEYKVNGTLQPVRLVGGLPVLHIPEGKSNIELIFRNTPVRSLGNMISLLSVVSVLYFYYGRKTHA